MIRIKQKSTEDKLNIINFYYANGLKKTLDKYKVIKTTLYRWLKKLDNQGNLNYQSNPNKKPHPNSHTKEEIDTIKKILNDNPNISFMELYGNLKNTIEYSRHPKSLNRFLRKNNYLKSISSTKTKTLSNIGIYHTPKQLGIKWQLDVKFIPIHCFNSFTKKYYQYTIMDEASRERFIYPYPKHNSSCSCDFIKRAFNYFGYYPKEIQTDGGLEFCYSKKTTKQHPFIKLLNHYQIIHHRLKPGTPQHNGKIERSHRNDNERFYNNLSFKTYKELKEKMQRYLITSNNIPNSAINYHTPKQQREILIKKTSNLKYLKNN